MLLPLLSALPVTDRERHEALFAMLELAASANADPQWRGVVVEIMPDRRGLASATFVYPGDV